MQLTHLIAKLQAVVAEMQLLMLAGWLPRKRGTSTGAISMLCAAKQNR